MSARSTAKPSSVAAPAAPIQFRDDFLSSSAALAASNEESVRSILSRLDMLQSKVVSADEIAPKATTTTTTTAPRAAKLSTAPLDTNTSSLHARISQLESVHQDHLTRLGAQLSAVENQLIKNSGDNATMHEISAKFGQIESHIRNQGDASERISRLESQLSSLQSRGSSSTELHARIRSLESEVSELRTATEPHPEQESLLRRINSRLDDIETKRGGSSDYLGARSSESLKTAPAPRAAPSSSGVTAERQKYLAARIDKLKELRSRYE
jgi:TolA-binding protein